jgi:AraC-like DNA-binding protein/quercetin dioxygenase-like cupin family protein
MSWRIELAWIGKSGNRSHIVMAKRVSQPIAVKLPPHGVFFLESSHAADFRMNPRRDPYHKLIYVLDGEVAYRETAGNRIIPAHAGGLIRVPAGTEHQITDTEPATLLLMCFRRGWVAEDSADLWAALLATRSPVLWPSRPAQQRLESMWRRAMFEWEHRRLGSATQVQALAAQTLVLLARLPVEEEQATAQARVQAVKEELDETFYDEWDLDRAAGRAGLSRRRFTDLFRAEAGQTFGAYLSELRLEHAAKLLRSGEHSVTGVMFACGFNDVSHFYRCFRQRFGQPPRAWSAHENRD